MISISQEIEREVFQCKGILSFSGYLATYQSFQVPFLGITLRCVDAACSLPHSVL